jgi:anti-sigma factor RsiW
MLAEVEAWLTRLYDDVVATPAERRFQEHAKSIDEITARLNGLPDEPLTQSDIKAFSDGLETLKAELSEELRRHAQDKDELQQRVQQMTHDIEFLRTTLASMTKRQWAELFVARLEKWKDRFSLKQLSAGARVAKLLLPAGADEAIDSVTQVIDGIAEVVDEAKQPPGDAQSPK